LSAHPSERELVVVDALGERRFASRDFPVSLGGTGSTVLLAGVPDGPLAYLGRHEGEIFVQPQGGAAIQHNGVPLSASAWLRADDVIRIGAASVRAVERRGELVLEIQDGAPGNITAPPIIDNAAIGSSDLAEAERIEAIRFKATAAAAETSRKLPTGRLVAGGVAVVLAMIAWFIFTAKSVSVTTEPVQANVQFNGFLPAFKWQHRFLVRPGNYNLLVEQKGYRPRAQRVQVTAEPNQELKVQLEKLPGRVRVEIPAQGTIAIDDAKTQKIPAEFELAAGPHRVAIAVDRYAPFAGTLEVTGLGTSQVFKPTLTPRWAPVKIASEPSGAQVLVDGVVLGTTPLSVDVLEGRHPLELRHEGFSAWTTDFQVKANEPVDLGSIKLGVADGEVLVRSDPAGAGVTVGGVYRGTTPLTVSIRPDRTQAVIVGKPGYENAAREVSVKSAERRTLDVTLTGTYGDLTVRVTPADAQLFVDGQSSGGAQQTLKLLATTHEIEVRKPGYAIYKTTVTPRPGIAQVVETQLITQEQAHFATYPNVVISKGGPTLKLMPRGSYTMGSPRREPGRRANEVQRPVELKRPFYIGVYEVTNTEFKRFKEDHHSGFAGNSTLELETQPVVMVSWEQAASYCNWLSKQDGLQPAYVEKDGKLVAVAPMTTGYRLPTDAEWEWVARYTSSGQLLRYPWGDALPVEPRTGNYADTSARIIVEDVVPNYDDGYVVTAPVGKFPPNVLGLYDIGGNVAEWAHDYYVVGVEASKPLVDPMGPADGGQHVIRGSSWRHASATDLRLSARDFSERARNDVGFRIARYAE
jgi:formylglycine-generating enzyme required for sulfatase activity